MNENEKDFYIKYRDELYNIIYCKDKEKKKIIYDAFSFFTEGYKYMPKFKYGIWDGKIHLFNLKNNTFPNGLLFDLIKIFQKYNYTYTIDPKLYPINFEEKYKKWEENTLYKLQLYPYDYQIKAFEFCLKANSAFILSPTASGKSLIIYLLLRYFIENTNFKILISVPKINLVEQLYNDINIYEDDYIVCDERYKMISGGDKNSPRRIIIATWQMLIKQPPSWFKQFDCFICDEAHQANSKSLTKIIESMKHLKYRYGFTGTLDGKIHELQCRAWFGLLYKTKTTSELIKEGFINDLNIYCIQLNHNTNFNTKLEYQKEIDYIISDEKRNRFILDTAFKQKHNTIVLFNYIEKHGDILYDMAKKEVEKHDKQIFKIIGNVDVNEREYIRTVMSKYDNILLFASFGTMSMGANIPNLQCAILAHPFKAPIRILQSIGRTLRKSKDKDKSIIIDIIDNISYKFNYTYIHGIKRIKLYKTEKFNTYFSQLKL